MNECIASDIQEALPDLLHNTLDADKRARVEAHLSTCESCREDLEVLRIVKSAAVFAPPIDVDRVVRQIPPYRTIVPAVETPARTRMVSWLVAAGVALAVVGGGSVLVMNERASAPRVATTIPETTKVTAQNPASTFSGESIQAPQIAASDSPPQAHALALAAGVDGLSDGSLVQLMNDMDDFDALPASEPEPVISMENGEGL
jgi:anti-sigma factor RsiW